MNPDEPIAMVDRVFGDRYRVVASIGGGAATHVFVADDIDRGGRVAIKVFDQSIGEDPEYADRVIAVVQEAASVEHPNIASITDWGLDGVRLWIVSELCGGGSLRSMLAHGNLLTPSQTLVMSLESARALAHAHSVGLTHRGLKPENVLFSTDQRLRLCDFGLSEVLADAPRSYSTGAVEQIRYQSPEQAGGREIAPATDLYALALITNEAISGEPPAVAHTVIATKMARAESVVEFSGDLRGLRGPLERCGRLDPDARPEAGELAIALLATAETMARPGPLALVGIPGIDDESAVADVPVRPYAVPGGLPARPDADADAEADDDDGAESAVELAVVPDLTERVVLEDLDTLEPIFADREVDDPILDVPTSTVKGSTGVFRPEAHDSDDRLPIWPLLVLGLIIAAAVVVALVVRTASDTGPDVLPNVVGLSIEEVDGLAADSGWNVVALEARLNGTVAGLVVAQEPEAGRDLDSGQTLTVTISLGAEMVEIPNDLSGLNLEQAQNRLEEAGLLIGTVTEENSEALDAGLVIGLDEPTRQKPAGEAVAVRVSAGPEARVVPATVIGTTIADATALLTGLRLQALEEQVYDPVAEPGVVLATVPSPGQIVPADSQVTLLVSAGPEPVQVPDLAELSLAEAVDALEALGLIFVDTLGTPGEPVIGTIPAAGDIVDVGAEVTIVLDDPPEEVDDEAVEDE